MPLDKGGIHHAVVHLAQRGKGQRTIAQELGISRNKCAACSSAWCASANSVTACCLRRRASAHVIGMRLDPLMGVTLNRHSAG
jgi:hypothetical protein